MSATADESSFVPQPQARPQWPQPELHLQVPVTAGIGHSFPSPSPVSSINEAYPPWYQSPIEGAGLASGLSGLSMTSSANVSPVAPTNISPVTPPAHAAFAFAPHDIGIRYEDGVFDTGDRRHSDGVLPADGTPESAISRKRSHQDLVYDDVDMTYSLEPASPADGSASGGELDETKVVDAVTAPTGKSTMSNNFVAKLYQMIIHPKSAAYIQWTEHGTSFVVSNVGEFSRNILGSHFKHSNFSSFVRQLNMYGFHKINRTPRSQRQSPDSQVWEFSHTKFLRGRPDLLEEIKRKALDTEVTGPRHRVELPGELHSQLVHIREENARMARALRNEQDKVARLTDFTRALHDVVARAIPGALSMLPPFPEFYDATGSPENPNIYITSFPPGAAPLPFPMPQTSLSAQSSPTGEEPPPFVRGHAPLARHSFTHLSVDSAMDEVELQGHAKRPRLELMNGGGRRLARARSESAPLGVPLNAAQAWGPGMGAASAAAGAGARGKVGLGGMGAMPAVTGTGVSGVNVVPKRGQRDDVMPSIARSATGRGQTPLPM